jgi:hypothetical protein
MKSATNLLFSTLFLLIFSWPAMSYAQDVKAMEREINSELRNAQNLMFNGKAEESDAKLNKVAELIEALKSHDPGNAQIKSLEQRMQKQRTDLDRRMPAKFSKPETPKQTPAIEKKEVKKDSGPQSSGASTQKTDTVDQPKALPRNTRQEMQTLNRAIQSLETTEKDRLKQIQEGDSHYMQQMESTLKRIQEKLDELPGLYEQVLAAANAEGVGDHPEINEARRSIDQVTAWAKQEMAASRAFVEKAEAGKALAAGDAKELEKKFEEYRQTYFDPIGNLRYAYMAEDIQKAFVLLEAYGNEKKALEKILADYEAKYGTTRDDIEKATGGMANVYPWQNMKENMGIMDEVPVQLAAKIKETIESELGSIEKRHDFYRLSAHNKLQKLAGYQKKYAPNAPAVENLEQLLAQDVKKFEERIDQRIWPACKGKSADRKGALKYFQETWGKDEKQKYTVLSTVITGDWSVQKKDITGKPTMYGLPVLLAVQTPEDKTRGLARVFILTVRTLESGNPKMEPPFTSDTVGDSYFIRTKNVK